MKKLSIRNITCDHYFSESPKFSGRVPILRIFGITEDGRKCCAHIHECFPYIWMRVGLPLTPEHGEQIKRAVKGLIGRVPDLVKDPNGPVVRISDRVCKSIYGYTKADESFAKIELRDPKHVQFLAKALQKQALANYNAQPFSAHVPYILQFFIDYDIFGMGLVHFDSSQVRFRCSTKQTKMEVEFDVTVDAILNSEAIANCPYVNTGLEIVYSDERDRRGEDATQLPASSLDNGRVAEVLPLEQEYLDTLRSFLRETVSSQNIQTQTTILDEEFMESMSQIVDAAPQGLLDREETSDSPLWENLEHEMRGFNVDEDNESDDEQMAPCPKKRFQAVYAYKGEEIKPVKVIKASVEPFVLRRPNRRLRFDAMRNPEDFLHKEIDKPSEQAICNPLTTKSAVPHLCAMALEVLALPDDESAGVADPKKNPIIAVGVAVCQDVVNWNGEEFDHEFTIISAPKQYYEDVVFVDNERDLLSMLANLVSKFNPDILIGYDLVRSSWNYVCERAKLLNHQFVATASRLQNARFPTMYMLLVGRIKLEVWQLIRHENPLRCYDFGFVVTEILDRTYPQLYVDDLMRLTNQKDPVGRIIAANHTMEKSRNNLRLLNKLGVFVRTSQMAQLYGIQYTEVLNRGSQFRVESMLLRIAKKSSFLPPSVSVEQRNRMGAPETIPLTLEPLSGIYGDPIAVLDFQSLYPSVLIAYNYCYSTCLGKVKTLCKSANDMMIKLGALKYERPDLESLKSLLKRNQIHVAPTGCVFVKEETQKSLVASMLKELLDARVMIKKSMKRYKEDPKTYKQLDAQQLALKLVANTTYGYAAANWSGRMPCEEVAEAIVSKGREALERAIEHIQSHSKDYEDAEVIYGDTDSIFVKFPGSTVDRAFELGRKIADAVTEMNPSPMKLKFEKIMCPTVLLTKKRYVGMSYENSPDDVPKFDAKGIETVRRDSCSFVSNMMENCLRIMFEKSIAASLQFLKWKLSDMSKFPYSDFVFNAKFNDHYKERSVVPAKKIASQMAARSPLYAPLPGERLSYVVVVRLGKDRVIDRVVSLEEFLKNPRLRIDWNHYVTKPLYGALSRVMCLVPVRLNWKPFELHGCIGCKAAFQFPMCSKCQRDDSKLREMIFKFTAEAQKRSLAKRECQRCLIPEELSCDFPFDTCANMRCEIAEIRIKDKRDLSRKLLKKLLPETDKRRLFL
ncbi:DNA polymerase [Aphelenchoides besseyi]|nr:DNA polymerase [Aphelenchoides besseyi]